MSKDRWTIPEANLRRGSLDLNDFPYLKRLEGLQRGYPALWFLLGRLRNSGDEGRRLINARYLEDFNRAPGRCAMLTFHDDSVESEMFNTAEGLQARLQGSTSTRGSGRRRLFVLEDMEPKFVDVLGQQLSVDPLVFSEQMNTWNSTSSKSVPHRALPSLTSPERSFVMRYYEIRTLDNAHAVDILQNQMTYAVNRRKYERWRDVDLPNVEPDKRHAFVRRCASFWTSQVGDDDEWDAVILVDPPMTTCTKCDADINRADKQQSQVHSHYRRWKTDALRAHAKPSSSCDPGCLILQDPIVYRNRQKVWDARNWKREGEVLEVPHRSGPYHGGCHVLHVSASSKATASEKLAMMQQSSEKKPESILDALVLYWTTLATKDSAILEAAKKDSVNASHYLLKIIAQHWTYQLELIAHGVSNTEWFADDYEARIDSRATLDDWKRELMKITDSTKDINYMRRQLNHFERAILLNLERLGVQIGAEAINDDFPLALRDAQRDLLTISARLRPFRERADDLSSIANEVAGLRASFKSIQDGELGLRLSLFAAIIFPLTLVASLFSMSDGYRPGQGNFWVFWASSVPLALVLGMGLMFGRRPEIWVRKWLQEH